MFVSRHSADDVRRKMSFTANKISVVELSWNVWNLNYFITEISKPWFLSTMLVLGWFFKPKVVFDSPETKLQCMSPELNKNMFNGLAKDSFEKSPFDSRFFLNSCVRTAKIKRVWSNVEQYKAQSALSMGQNPKHCIGTVTHRSRSRPQLSNSRFSSLYALPHPPLNSSHSH